MTVSRSIYLDVSVPQHGQSSMEAGAGRTDARERQNPDKESQERFDRALATAPDCNEEITVCNTASPTISPFALLAKTKSKTDVLKPERTTMYMNAQVGDAVERLMVGEGSNGNQQVRIELKDDVLVGVTVAIEKVEGRWQVDFICSVEESRLRLNATAQQHAQTLAERLEHPVLVRVQTNDEADLWLLEVAASPPIGSR
jgi:hypothetical protein